MKRNRAFSVLTGTIVGLALVGCDYETAEEPTTPTDRDTTTPPPDNVTTPPSDPVPPPTDETPTDDAETATYVGVLQSGVAGIGGEHTGWMLTGTAQGDIEVDVTGVANALELD